MKRALTIFLVAIALLFGTAFRANTALAANPGETCILSDGSGKSGQVSADGKTCVDVNSTNKPTETGQDSNKWYNQVIQKIMSLFAWLVGVAAILLDYVVYYTVVRMGDLLGQWTAIGTVWRILRDVANIALIFGFLAIGISVILDLSVYGWGKTTLPKLLIVAVLLNFSLFAAELVIDIGNLFATQVFTQINGGSMPVLSELKTHGGNAENELFSTNEGISTKIMSQLGLQTIYSGVNSNPNALLGQNPFLTGFMGIILFVITAFVLFSLALILVFRFVALVFIIILAPIGFVGLAIPKLSSAASQWWSQLIGQTITAPVLLLMLYIALAVITDVNFLTGFNAVSSDGSWLGFVDSQNVSGFAGILLSFLVAMGLLLAVTAYAKKLSAFGADTAMKWGGKASFGLAAWGGRSTIGWGSQRLSQAWRQTRFSRAPVIGRAVSGALDRGAKASFDVRPRVKSVPYVGVDAGEAQKGGYREWEKKKTKEREEYAKTLQQTRGPSFGFQFLKGEKEQQEEAQTEALDAAKEIAEMQKKEEQAQRRLQAAKEAEKEYSITDTRNEVAEAEAEVQTVQADISAMQEKMSDINKKITELKQAPQKQYAAGLSAFVSADQNDAGAAVISFINPTRNTKAAENIMKEVRKKQPEKDIDALKKLLEDAAKKESNT